MLYFVFSILADDFLHITSFRGFISNNRLPQSLITGKARKKKKTEKHARIVDPRVI